MTITKATAEALAALYGTREHLQRQRERATSRNAWIGFIERGAVGRSDGTGTREATELEMIVDALGGRGEVATIFMQATIVRFESMQRDLDQQIVDLGGEA